MRSGAVNLKQRAAALVIVLALVVLLLVLVTTYFTRVANDRAASASSVQQSTADEIAGSATETVIGDLRQEIITGSTPTTLSSYTIYAPTAATLLPTRSGNPAYAGGPANDPIPNLVRRSWANDTNLNPRSRASGVSSTLAPLNGHSVTSARWNKHYLVPRAAGAAAGDTTPISGTSGFTPPDWVLVTRAGAAVQPSIGTGSTAINNAAPSNTNYVLGRYAYAIYDEGGLIDVNVAGYPTNTTAAQYGIKGVSAFADLTLIPGLTQPIVDNLVAWRNYAAAQLNGSFPFSFNSTSATNYVTYVTGKTDGFLTVGPNYDVLSNNRTNQQFVNRQSLIQFRSLAGIPEDSLQYLSTYSRELNAPSWTPTLNATDMGAANNGPVDPSGRNIYAYNSNANPNPPPSPLPTPINPDFLKIRVGNSFVRADGSTAFAGEPLVRRFPLTRLAGVGATGPATGTNSTMVNGLLSPASATTIQRDFGLVWDSGNSRWNYVGATGTTVQTSIERLDQVATENREPNFFEVLKAAILSGSIGLGSGSANTFATSEQKYYMSGTTPTNLLSSDSQIIQIGANIIDQADSDKNPTFINFAGNEFAGIENLPYLNKLVYQPRWSSASAFGAWLVPSFWNPAQNGTAVGTQSATIPAIRFVMTAGTARGVVESAAASARSTTVTANTSLSPPSPSLQLVRTADFFSTPNTPSNSSDPSAGMSPVAPNNTYGIPFVFSALGTVTRANTTRTYPIITNATFEMQAQVGGTSGPWKTYQRWTTCNVNVSSVTSMCQPGSTITGSGWGSSSIYDPEYVVLDPRTIRFGVWETHGSATGDATDYTRGYNETMDRGSGSGGFQLTTGMPPQGSFFSGVSANFAGAQMANNTSIAPDYRDLDGVLRQGDSLNSGHTSATLPANSLDRPLIIARSYQSVAELGQVFRDQPWKTLNFTTGNSADAALLDAFTLHEGAVEAGKTSLNTRQTVVLRAILSQVLQRLNVSTTSISSTQRDNIVTALQNLTTNQPMLNKAELVSRLAADNSVIILGSKEARECVIRAFADACQTRTWNLMIDVIAQSGRYPSTANSLANFIVTGEQHYWVHVAIDRFTGKVVDKQIEVVNE